jgi:hypothetical protein
VPVNGHHFGGSGVTKSAIFPEGKMNREDAALQHEKIMSKKGRRRPAFSTLDERRAEPDTVRVCHNLCVYSAGGSANG